MVLPNQKAEADRQAYIEALQRRQEEECQREERQDGLTEIIWHKKLF